MTAGRLRVAAFIVAIAVAGCGGSDSTAPSSTSVPTVQDVSRLYAKLRAVVASYRRKPLRPPTSEGEFEQFYDDFDALVATLRSKYAAWSSALDDVTANGTRARPELARSKQDRRVLRTWLANQEEMTRLGRECFSKLSEDFHTMVLCYQNLAARNTVRWRADAARVDLLLGKYPYS